MACPVCGDVIGVYEPLLVVGAGSARTSSLAREPLLGGGEAVVVHLACGDGLGVTGHDAAATKSPASDL